MVGLVVGDDAQGGAQGGPDTQGQGREQSVKQEGICLGISDMDMIP